jgi:3-(methylthio)propanoyl-CoA dehydrogenase
MTAYVPPLDDIEFVLDEIVDLGGLAGLPAFKHADPPLVNSVLEEAGRFVSEVIAPLNRVGDRQHSRRNADGTVTTPDGFRQAYAQWVAAGWGGVPFPSEFGGGGFPWAVGVALQELVASANLAFCLCPLLTQGAIDLLLAHGSDAQRQTYLPRMVSGEWTGSMNLTEPQAGSDVGAVRTKAVLDAEGRWRITGEKIFITYGEHDMADNIVHLVLARVPDAPPGTRGISCFIVPKTIVQVDGSLGARNGVTCVSIEDKLGIHASPTCVLSFDQAYGELIGEANRGMQYMFTMMNNARLSVGLQGIAVGEAAYQQAVAYAGEREQGRPLDASNRGAATIIDHPDVRRMLLTQKAFIEAGRALIYLVAGSIDWAEHHPDSGERAARTELVELLTPVAKAWTTDLGVELTSLAMQVHGGMGYIEETGVAQYYRDVRIAPIYEGTNGIQAIDLVTRKLSLRGGAVVGEYLSGLDAIDLELEAAGAPLAAIRANLAEAVARLRLATEHALAAGLADQLAGASPYLRMFGLVTGGWLMARQALAATARMTAAPAADRAYLQSKLVTARFYCEQILPQAGGLLAAVTARADDLLALDPSQF